ncbi:Ig-like domain-containing protein [Halomonas sp. M20]|uniref:Ig-like domain-containing protein n=1 Tax=Halomonas sp. M20 TaxID=2763264 RepID=UPI001D0BE2E9|nr:Ig-like domain-containing protein [Halomonas sp. M20]
MPISAKISRLVQDVTKVPATVVADSTITLQQPSNVLLSLSPDQVVSIVRSGNSLLVETIDGQLISINNFYGPVPTYTSQLHLLGEEQQLLLAELGPTADTGLVPAEYTPLGEFDAYEAITAIQSGSAGGTGLTTTGLIAGGGTIATAGTIASNSQGRNSNDNENSPLDGGNNEEGEKVRLEPPTINPTNGETISGTAGSDISIIIRDGDGNLIGKTTSDINGDWFFGPEPKLADGTRVIVRAGDDDNLSSPVYEIVDAIAPTIDDNFVIFAEKIFSADDAESLALSGRIEPGAVIKSLTISDSNGNTVTIDPATITLNEDGTFSVASQNGSTLAEGELTANLSVSDAAGNIATFSDTATLDLTLPETPTINPTRGDTLTGTAEPGSTVVLTDGEGNSLGEALADDNGDWSFQPAFSLANSTEVTATTTDTAGNISEPATMVIDRTRPEVPVIRTASDDVLPETQTLFNGDSTNNSTPSLSGRAEAGSTIIVFGNGSTLGTAIADQYGAWSFTPTNPLYDGDVRFTAKSTDAAGNISFESSLFTLSIDTQPPEPPVIDPTNGEILTGSAEAGNAVNLTDSDGNHIATVVADRNGNWSYALDIPLEDSINFSATAIDAAGNISSPRTATVDVDLTDNLPPANPIILMSIDATDPVTGELGDGSSTNEGTPTLVGMAEATNIVQVWANATMLGTTQADSFGNWRFTLNNRLANGNISFTATSVDPEGNVSAPSASYALIIDTDAPDAPTLDSLTDDTAPMTDELAPDESTNDSLPALGGTAEAGSTVTILANGSAIGTTTADEQGSWQFTPENTLSDGGYRFTVTATDAAGNVSNPSDIFELIVDTLAPTAPTLDPTNGTTVSGTGEAGSTITLTDAAGSAIGDPVMIGTNGVWSVILAPPLVEGAVISAIASDSAGNTSDSVSAVVDATRPEAPMFTVSDDITPVTGVLADGDSTNDATPTLTGSAESDSVITIFANGSEIGTANSDGDGNWTFTPDGAVSEGSVTFTATATDATGNVSDSSASVTLTIDTLAPAPQNQSIAFMDGGDGSLSAPEADNVRFSGRIATGNEVVSLIISDTDGNELGVDITDITVDADGSLTATPQDLSGLNDGKLTATLTVNDAAGNATNVVASSLLDTLAPDIGTSDLETNDTAPALSGNVNDPAAVVVVTLDGIDYPAINNGDGTWTLPNNALSELPEGNTHISVTATDPAGNVSQPITSTITVDLEPPDVTIEDLTTNDPSPTLTGNVSDPTANVIVTIDEQDYLATNNGDGTWRLADDTLPQLTDGDTTVIVTVTVADAAGNTAIATGTVTFDTQAPTVSVENLVTNDTTPALTGTVNDEDAVVTVTVDGTDYIANNNQDGTWTLADDTLAALVTGNNAVSVIATDPAGNLSQPATGSVTVDLETPTVTLDDLVTSHTTPDLSGNVSDPAATVTVKIDEQDYIATNNGDGTWTLNGDALPELNEGENAITVTVTAADGTENKGFDTATITVDLSDPSVTVNDTTTNDTTPTLNGTVDDPTAKISVTVDGDVYTANNNGDGTWTLAGDTLPSLGDGDYTVEVTATDIAGNASPTTSGMLTIDIGTPSLTFENLFTNDTTPALSGAVDDPTATVTLTLDGIDYIATNNGDGSWSLPSGTLNALDPGETAVSVTATDPAGNESITSGTVAVDLTAPIVTFDGLATNDTKPELTGTIDDPTASVTVTVGVTEYTATNNGDGSWTLADDTLAALDPGGNTIGVTAIDQAGNVSQPATGTVDVDIETPTVTFDDLLTNDTTPDISGSVSDPTAIVTVTIDGQDYRADNDGNGGWALSGDVLPPLEYGANPIVVTVSGIDETGNTGIDTGTIIIDMTTPSVTVEALSSNDTTPTLNGTVDDPNATVTVTVDDKSYTAINNGDGTWTLADNTLPTLGEGDYEVSVTAIDLAGNASPTVVGALSIDTGAPTVSFDDLATNEVTPTLSGSIDDPTATVRVAIDGGEYNATNNGDGTWTLDDASPTLAENDYEVSVAATDAAGNTAINTGTLVIDLTAPSVTFEDLDTNDRTPALSGTVNDPTATVSIFIDGNEYTAINNGDGSWTLGDNSVAPALDEGDHEVSVTATDAAGNTGPATTGTLTIDNSALVVSLDDLTTSDTTPALSGIVTDPDASVTVTVNGIDYEADNNGDGTWTLADNTLPVLAENVYSVSVAATDAANNTVTDTGTLSVDTTAPLLTVDDFITNDTTPVLTGTVDDTNATVTVTINDVDYTATNNGDGTWILADDTLPMLGEGNHEISVTATDMAGNGTTDTGALTIDTGVPNVTFDDVITNDAKPMFAGTIDDPTATVSVFIDGNEYTATNNGDGSWTLADNALPELGEGDYEVSIAATDEAGNIAIDSATLTIDLSAPSAAFEDVSTNDTTPALHGGVDDPAATVTVTVDGESYTASNNGDGTWTLADDTLPPLNDGDYTVAVIATDIAGNTGPTTSGTLTIDTVTPTLTVEDLVTDDTKPALSGTVDDPTATVTVSVDGVEYFATNNGDGTWTLADETLEALAPGETAVSVTATDPAGNESVASATLTLDQDAPTATIDDLVTSDTTPALSGSVDDPDASITITLGDTEYTATNNGDGTWTLADDALPSLGDGGYTVAVTATDAAGNTGPTKSGTLTVDTLTPTLTVDDLVTNDTTPSISGTVDDPTATVIITVDSAEYAGTNNGDGTWTLADDSLTELPEGDTEISVTATDPAGNESIASATVTLDRDAPTATIDDLVTSDTTPALSGRVDDPAATVTVTVDGESYAASNNGDGTWTLADDILPPLDDGDYTVAVAATDIAGNTSPTTSGLLTVDTGTPTLTIDSLITNDTTPALNGMVDDPDANVIVTVRGTDYIATNNGDGTWTLDNDSLGALVPSVTEVSVTATDPAGNSAIGFGTITLDQAAPAVTVTDLVTNDTTPLLSGTVDDFDATVTVTIGDTEYTATNNGDGTWTLADNTLAELGSGDNQFSVAAVDPAGNISDPATGTVTVDVTTPTLTVNDQTTNDTTPALMGIVDDPEATIVVTVGEMDYIATNNDDGTWTLADDALAPLSEGDTDVSVSAIDPVGNQALAYGTITVDLTAPTVTFDDLTTNDTTPVLSGTVNDSAATVTVMVGGMDYYATNNGDGTWTLASDELTALNEGETEVSVTATDLAGNTTTPATGIVRVDITAPTVTLEALITNDDTPALSGTIDDPVADIVVDIDGVDYAATNNGDGTWTLADDTLATLPEGEVSVTVHAIDPAGNSDTITNSITVDVTVPDEGGNTIAFVDGGDGLLSPGEIGSVTLGGEVESGATVTSLIISDNEGTTLTIDSADISVDTGGNLSVTAQDLSGLNDGQLTAMLLITDAAGNTGTVIDTTTLDTTAPTIDATAANVSEVGLESTASIGVFGIMAIGDSGSGVTSIEINGPAGVTSAGDAVVWSGIFNNDVYNLNGTASGITVATLTISTSGAYTYTQSQAFDHPLAGEDILALGFDVTASDRLGNQTSGELTLNLADDAPTAVLPAQFEIDTGSATASGSFVESYGADGGYVSQLTIDDYTFSYDPDSNSVSARGSSELIDPFVPSDYDSNTGELTIRTVKGETLTVDMRDGSYNYDATGANLLDPEPQADPAVTLGDDDSLLGLVGVEAL